MHNLLQYKAWALEESFFNQWAPIVLSGRVDSFIKKTVLTDHLERLDNLIASGEQIGHPPISADVAPNDVNLRYDINGQLQAPVFKVGNKNIAVLPMIGPLSKYGDMCSMGMQSYQTLLNRINANPEIHATVILGDSPGGTVDGTPELGVAIKNSAKPVVWFADGVTASAAMWLASQCAMIVANKNNPTQLGSIGALRVVENYSKMMELGNMPEMDIVTAPQSSEKVRFDPTKPWKEDDLKNMAEEVRPYAAMIIDGVKDGRGDRLDQSAEGLFKGRMFDAYKAKQIGLIDAVGTLQTALNKAAELARERAKAPLSISPKGETFNEGINSNANMKFKSNLFGNLFGKPEKAEDANPAAAASADVNHVQAADEKVAALETQLADLQEKFNAAEARATAAEANVTELNTQLSALTSEKATLEATVAEQKEALAKKPTGHLTTVVGKKPGEEAVATDVHEEPAAKPVTQATQETMSIVEQLDKLKTPK